MATSLRPAGWGAHPFGQSTMDDPFNPYASPQVDIPFAGDLKPATGHAFDALTRQSVLLMILWSVLTLGLYLNYWFHQLANTLNQRLTGNPVPMVLVGLFWVLSLGSILWTIPEIVMDDDPRIVEIGSMLVRADMVFGIVMAFVMRGGLNRLIGVTWIHPAWFRGLWTFLFGAFYLQWKINQNLPRLIPPDTGE